MFEGGWPGSARAAPESAFGGSPVLPLVEFWERFVRSRTLRLRNLLVESYHRLVRETLRHLRPRPSARFDRHDLESAGVFGLLRAVERFDPDRGVRFETFAGRWVRGAILEEVRRADPWPRKWRERSARLEEACARFRDRHGREPTDGELARALRVSLERYRSGYARLRDRELPVFPRLFGEEDPSSGGAAALPANAEPPYERLARRELLDLALSLLDSRERAILHLRYFEGCSMGEIGARVGLHESRVCRIHAQALARIRARLRSRAWEAA
ncbi:MAG: sigma-70 family RNA polymerase sigma factor [Planctomycetes bacterium]|nr:sigma-70 family RNA polymerase sigma factor [Planctomycetota bacterium]